MPILGSVTGAQWMAAFLAAHGEEFVKQIAKQKFDIIYTCGPEKMMQKIFFLAEQYKIPIQASLERIVRCSVGLCGSCMIGKLRVCKDGPIFSAEQLREFKDEFGKFKRDLSSRRVKV